MHHSQKIIKDNDRQLIVELAIAITYDFVQEILHFGKEVNVLQPLSLAKEIVKISEAVVKKYK